MNPTTTIFAVALIASAIALVVPTYSPVLGALLLVLMIASLTPYLIKGIVLRRELAKYHFANASTRRTFFLFQFLAISAGLYWAGVAPIVFIAGIAICGWLWASVPSVKAIIEIDKGHFRTAFGVTFLIVSAIAWHTAGYKFEPMTTGTVTLWAIAYIPLSMLAAITLQIAVPIILAERQHPEVERILIQHLVDKGIRANRANLNALKREVPETYRKALKLAAIDKSDANLDLMERSGKGVMLFRGFATIGMFPVLVAFSGPVFLLILSPYIAVGTILRKYDIKSTMQDVVRGTRVVRA